MTLAKFEFCEAFVHLHGGRISFADRPYLREVYGSEARNFVIRASRQTEKSTFIVNTLLYEMIRRPGVQVLLVTPRLEQASVLVRSRLIPALQQSPLLRRALLGRSKKPPQLTHMQFRNDSQLFVRAAFRTADAVRGISADILLVDEIQDIAAGDLPVLQETLSHSKLGRTVLCGTPKMVENILECTFSESTANEWTLTCPACRTDVILDEFALGPHGIICRHCQAALDVSTGRWVPRNPGSFWGAGFWLNHAMVPWLDYEEILNRQRIYDVAKFKNEVLGLSTTLGEHVVSRAELEACCDERPMAEARRDFPAAARDKIIAGIDWGGGGKSRTVVVLGWMRKDFVFEIRKFCRFRPDEDTDQLLHGVAELLRKFHVRYIAADGGGSGHHLNRLLLDRLNLHHGMYAILYSATDQEPRQEGLLLKWTVNRSATIGSLFSRVKKGSIVFPRTADCGSFLDEFACELATFDDLNRTIRYTHPDNVQDDAMHAANYALLLGVRYFHTVGENQV
jgi:hypothetical protein